MSKSIKIIALLMAMMFVFFAFASCTTGDEEGNVTTTVGGNDTPDDPTGTTQGNGTVTDKPENTTTGNKYDIGTEIPTDVKFDGETVNIASRSNSDWVKDEITVEFMSGGVQDTIFNRQVKVEDTLGITINNIQISASSNYEISNHLRDDFKANEYRYDVVANSCYSTIMYTTEGIFQNLFDIEYLDLSRPYWSQGFNESAEIGDAQYMCSGALALTFFRYMFVTFFNHTLAKNYGDVNFYELVDNYEWTLDYQLTYCEQFADTQNEALGADGVYGFISCNGNTSYIDPYWSSCKLPMLSKTADGWFEVAIDTDRMITAVDKLIKLFDEKNLGTYIYASSGDDTNQTNIGSHFAADRAATATTRLCAVEGEDLKNMSSVYGIIPMPMLNKEQKAYGTVLHDQFTAFGVYSRIPDAEKRLPLVGAFLETFAAESYKQVVPAYYDLALKNRYLQDEESGRMLDLIYESVYVDAGILYTKNLTVSGSSGISQEIRITVTNGTNNISQKYGPQTCAILKAQLKKMQDAIAKLQG